MSNLLGTDVQKIIEEFKNGDNSNVGTIRELFKSHNGDIIEKLLQIDQSSKNAYFWNKFLSSLEQHIVDYRYSKIQNFNVNSYSKFFNDLGIDLKNEMLADYVESYNYHKKIYDSGNLLKNTKFTIKDSERINISPYEMIKITVETQYLDEKPHEIVILQNLKDY